MLFANFGYEVSTTTR